MKKKEKHALSLPRLVSSTPQPLCVHSAHPEETRAQAHKNPESHPFVISHHHFGVFILITALLLYYIPLLSNQYPSLTTFKLPPT